MNGMLLAVSLHLALFGLIHSKEVIQIDTDTQVDVTSTNYPSQYPHSEDKEWVLTHKYGKWIIDIKEFHVEKSTDCTKDYLEISEDGVRTRRLCGRRGPTQIVSKGSNLIVRFHSDDSVQDTGFRLAFRRVLEKDDLRKMKDEGGMKKHEDNAATANVQTKDEFYDSLTFKVLIGSVGCAIFVFTLLITFLCLEMRKKRLERRSMKITSQVHGNMQWPPLTRSNSKSYGRNDRSSSVSQWPQLARSNSKSYGRQDSSSSTTPLTGNMRY